MSSEGDKLPLDLAWQADGHAGEVALSMIADGEAALLPDGVEGHIRECEACSARLGAEALLSLRMTEELPAIAAKLAAPKLAALAPAANMLAVKDAGAATDMLAVKGAATDSLAIAARAPLSRPIARPIPKKAILAALTIAAAGALPSLLNGLGQGPSFLHSALRIATVIGRSLISIFFGTARETAGIAPALSWLAAIVLAIVGLSLARTMSRTRSVQGGVG